MEIFLGIIATIATVYAAVMGTIQQKESNRLFAEQNRILLQEIEGQGKKSDDLPRYRPSRWPLWVMLGLVLVGWSAVLFHWLVTPGLPTSKQWSESAKTLKPITFKDFSNEDVELDGKRFDDCTFNGTTLIYRGKQPFVIEHSRLIGVRVKMLDGPPSAGAQIVLGILEDTCKGKERACDITSVSSFLMIIDEGKNKVPYHLD